jgi:hypothetical protein
MTSEDPKDWQTCAVTALPPGWLNVYRAPGDATASFVVSPCPAILLQEKVTVYNAACFEGVPWTERITRTVYATSGPVDVKPGQLEAACDIRTYVNTTTAADWATASFPRTETP